MNKWILRNGLLFYITFSCILYVLSIFYVSIFRSYLYFFRIVQTEDATPKNKVDVPLDNTLVTTTEEEVIDANVDDTAKASGVDSSLKEILEETFAETIDSISQNSGMVNE